MKPNMLLTLALLVLALVVGIFLASLDSTETDTALGEPVLPGLQETLHEVSRVSLTGGEGVVTLRREGNVWELGERDFPAMFEKLDGILTQLADAELIERKTALAENHGRLGLDYPGSAVAVDIDDGRYSILLGNEAREREGQYVRLPAEDQVWLIDRTIDAMVEPTGYLRRFIIKVPEAELVTAVYTSPSGDELLLQRDEETDELQIQDLPPGRELLYPEIADELALVLAYVRLEDVLYAEDAPDFAADRTHRLRVETRSGLLVEVGAMEDGERHLLKLTASLMPGSSARPSTDLPVPKPEAADQQPADQSANELLNPEAWLADNLPLLKGRVFVIPEYTYRDFNRTLESVLKELPEEDESDL